MDINRLLAFPNTGPWGTPDSSHDTQLLSSSTGSSSASAIAFEKSFGSPESSSTYERGLSTDPSEASFGDYGDLASDGAQTASLPSISHSRPIFPASFPCPSCDKVFRTKQGWKSHQYTHTGSGERPRPFCCTYPGCGRTFTQSGNLKTHTNTHTGERPYKCQFPGCGRGFGQGTNLRKHEASHLRERTSHSIRASSSELSNPDFLVTRGRLKDEFESMEQPCISDSSLGHINLASSPTSDSFEGMHHFRRF